MVDYPYASILVADAVTFQRAANASVMVYDITDTGNTTPLALTDLSGLALPNPLTSSSDAFLPPFVAQVDGVKLVGGGLTISEYSHKGMKDAAEASKVAAEAAQAAAQAAADDVLHGNPDLTVTYNSDGSVASTTENGVLSTFTYNTDGSVNTQTRAGVTKTFTYDANGNVTGAA